MLHNLASTYYHSSFEKNHSSKCEMAFLRSFNCICLIIREMLSICFVLVGLINLFFYKSDCLDPLHIFLFGLSVFFPWNCSSCLHALLDFNSLNVRFSQMYGFQIFLPVIALSHPCFLLCYLSRSFFFCNMALGLGKDCIEFQYHFGYYKHIKILIFQIHDWDTSLSIYVCFYQYFIIFSVCIVYFFA